MISPIETVKRWWRHSDLPIAMTSPATLAREVPEAPVHREPPWLTQLDRAGIPRTLVYPRTTLGRLVDQAADRFADATALIYNDKSWSYRELLALVNRLAGGLASLGVRRGDRVLLTLPNCPEFVTAFFAIQKLGAVVVNAGPLMGVDDMTQLVAMTNPRVAIGLDLQSPLLAKVAAGSSIRHLVWVTLQFYQTVFKRLGYQIKLMRHNGRHNGEKLHDVTMADLLAKRLRGRRRWSRIWRRRPCCNRQAARRDR